MKEEHLCPFSVDAGKMRKASMKNALQTRANPWPY